MTMTMKEIPFTQYIAPPSTTFEELQYVDRPEEIADKAYEVIAKGYRFTAMRHRGSVYLSCVPTDAPARAIWDERVANGPEVPKAVDRLVQAAYLKLKEKV